MRVSFLAALHNNLSLTRDMFGSLQVTVPTDFEHEILFVDNASSDGTRTWLESIKSPRVRTILKDQNLGYGEANNLAAREARGEVLVLLNNDITLLEGWFAPLIDGLGRYANPGLIGNVQFRVSDGRLDHRGVRLDLLRRPYHDRRPLFLAAGRRYSEYAAVTTACCAVLRNTFLETGGFDRDYRNGYEDIDLCLRLGRAGYRHFVANRSHVLHHVSASTGRFESESQNLRIFLDRWGWPGGAPPFRTRGLNYLGRHWLRPWRFNGGKLVLALAWLATGQECNRLQSRLGVAIDYKPR